MTFSTLAELLLSKTAAAPTSSTGAAPAYVYLRNGEDAEAPMPHAELAERATRLAGWMIAQGFAGQRALLVFPPGLEFIEAFMACQLARVVAVPVAPAPLSGDQNKVKRMLSILRDCQPALVLGVTQTIDKAPQFVDEHPDFHHLAWLALDTFGGWDGPVQLVPPAPDDLALLQYTSGSTASPKGVMLSHKNILHNLGLWDRGLGHDETSVMVCWVPHFHDLGLLYGVLFPLYRGIDAYLLPAAAVVQRPLRWLQAIARYRGTHSMGPNFIYDHCADRIDVAECAGLDLSSWQMALNAAEPIRTHTVRAFNDKFAPFGLSPCTMSGGFGLAEATCYVAAQHPASAMRSLRLSSEAMNRNLVTVAGEDELASDIVCCGPPAPGTDVRIVDPASLTEVAGGTIGEIWVRSDSAARGYWQRPDDNLRNFGAVLQGDPNPAPYMRTGDLGFIEQGDVFTTGRIKDLIIVRGENYYPQDAEWEIEHAHPGFKAGGCAVFSVERDGEEKIVIVQELTRHHGQYGFDDMFGAVRVAVGAVYDLPLEAIVFIRPGTTARTSSGKIQRGASRAAYLGGTLQVVERWDRPASAASVAGAPAAPSMGAIESFLLGRVADIAALPLAALDPVRPFAQYGLGSVDSTLLASELASRFGINVRPTAFYDHPSIRQLAAALTAAPLTEGAAAAPSEGDTIVAVGLACRFPGAPSAAAYWQLLCEGGSATSERIGADGTPRHGAFLEQVGSFDNEFFAISKREAACMDPQQRIALEVAWHAMEDAGVVPETLAGSATGVFFGASAFDYGALQLGEGELDAYSSQGSVLGVIANRIAYQFDLRGPSFVVDTACSSALTALHLAARSLREGECKMALVGAVNLLLAKDWDAALIKAGMLAPDGLCKTFDASANGYVRGEGCGVVVLKRLADAVRDGDRIYGAILGTAINQDGRSNGLTAPNGNAQEALLRTALGKAGVSAAELGYIEAHGTGTPLGDPIECAALRRVLGARETPCYVGSAKGNIGHLEAAAGMAGLIKTLLTLHHGVIPAQRNFSELNPLIELGNVLAIAREATPWGRLEQGRRCASVSAFGFSGANACVVLGEAAPIEAAITATAPLALPFVLSARDQPSLRRLAARYADAVPALDPAAWQSFLYTASCRRAAQAERFCAVVDSPAALAARLQALAAGGVAATDAPAGKTRIAFVFSGQGIPLAGAARALYERLPVFRDALARCSAVLEPLLGHSVASLLYEEGTADLRRPALAQPVQFSLQYALVQTFQAFGLRPDIVLGHSLGEYGALTAAGALPLDAALRLVAARGDLAERCCEPGAMASVFADEAAVLAAISASGLPLDLAAINGEYHCVVAGAPDAVAAFCEYLTEHGPLDYRKLAVERAYHSALIEPVLAPFAQMADGFNFFTPHTRVISNVTGKVWPADQRLDSDYLRRHLRQPVRFADALDTLAREQATIAIEIGSKPVLCSIGQAYLDTRGPRWLPALRHNGDDWRALLECLGQAFASGAALDWRVLFDESQRHVASTPPYAFDTREHWFAPRSGAARHSHEAPVSVAHASTPAVAVAAGTHGVPHTLARILGHLLHTAPQELDHAATYLQLGLDSIVLMEFTRLTNQAFHTELSVADMFEHYYSIERLARRLSLPTPAVELP